MGIETPKVSVLMAVYNGASYVRQAVESILVQTFPNFELVVVDDGSVDGTLDILHEIADSRLRLLKETHAGLTAALNRGGAACRGDFIARMDADDIAFPERLQVQLDYFSKNPQFGLVCADAVLINETGERIGAHRMGRWNDDVLRRSLLFSARAKPIIHPSVMMRREVFFVLNGYRDYLCAEDHDFWLRALDEFRFGHCAQPLLFYRVHPMGVSRSKRATQAINGVMSVITHLVDARERADMFAHHPDLFQDVRERTQTALALDFFPCETAFLEIRDHVKARRWTKAALALAYALGKHGLDVLPSGRARILRRIAETLAAQAQGQLKTKMATGLDRAPTQQEYSR